MYTLGEAAKQAGCSKSTISRAIKNGKLSANRLEDESYAIDPAELERWNSSNGHRNAKKKRIATHGETPETLRNISTVEAELTAARQLAEERLRTIDDLRGRLDKEAEERRQITTRLLEYEKPKGFWARLRGG